MNQESCLQKFSLRKYTHMDLYQSSRLRYKDSKCSALDVAETLRLSYISNFGTKDQMYSIQYILYKNSNNISRVKTCLTKRNPGEH